MSDNNVEEYPITVLPNGVEVLTHRMQDRASVSLGIWVRVGSRYEKMPQRGISHFIEHLVFKGTPKRNARQIKEAIEGKGGGLNAFTSEDSTCFYVKILKKHLNSALEVLADMVQNPLFCEEDIEMERTVILEELRMYMDLPMHYAHDLINELLWPKQPIGNCIAGDIESVTAITPEQIKTFHEEHYIASNFLIAACGDIEHEEIVDAVKSVFAGAKAKPAEKYQPAVSQQDSVRVRFEDKATEQTSLVLAMHSVDRNDPTRFPLGVLHMILGANMSSRLYEELRETRGLAYEIRSGINFYDDAGAFCISAGIDNANLEESLELIMKELSRLRKECISESELERAKEYMLSQLYFSLEDTMDHMLWMGEKALGRKSVLVKEKIAEKVRAVTCEDVKAVAERVFVDNCLNLVVVGPVEEERQAAIKDILKYEK